MSRRSNKKRDCPSGDVAVVGLALRFPGADDLDGFWQDLAAGRCRIGPVPSDRWDRDALHGDPRRESGKTNSIWGGFVEAADCFDAAFFGISPREARSMDPQQRFALELSWCAVEDSGIAPRRLAGSRTGVFMGVCHWDYAELFEKTGLAPDAYLPTGTAYSIIANRVSYFFDFTGLSVTNDTACASSLIAVEQAVAALRSGACDLALAGGVNLIWSPNHFIAFAKNGMLSPTGRSRAFDAGADGYVRGEGGAVLVLEPLERAVAQGRSIHAVIKAAGSNHGGRTSGLTVTNPQAQARLIQEVHAAAGVHPADLSYVEAHGTGTPVGDPIELMGLKNAFAARYAELGETPKAGTCGLGSVKTNIGHLEGAAGIAGMVKVIAAMRHGTLPPNAGFEKPNPMLRLDGSPFYVVDKARPWPSAKSKGPLVAGVSSFGFGGTNAHVVLASPPREKARAPGKRRAVVVPLSARDPERLACACRALAAWIGAATAPVDLAALAFTLQTGRDAMPARAAFVVQDLEALRVALTAAAEGTPTDGWFGNGGAPEPDVGKADQALVAGRLDEAAALWVAGGAIDWHILYRASKANGRKKKQRLRPLRLPTYPFARERHWFAESRPATTISAPTAAHPLMAPPADARGPAAVALRSEAFYLADHVIGGRPTLPGVVCLDLARALAAQGGPVALTDVVWLNPITADGEGRTVALARDDDGFRIVDGAARFCQGRIGARPACPADLDLAALRQAHGEPVSVDACYARLNAAGIVHGPAFRALAAVRRGRSGVVADLALADRERADIPAWGILPVMLDAAIQATVALLPADAAPGVPFAVDTAEFFGAAGPRMVAVARLAGDPTAASRRFDVELCHPDGRIAARLTGLVTRPLAGADATPPAIGLVQAVPEWIPCDPPVAAGEAALPSTLFLAGGRSGLAEELSGLLAVPVEALPPLEGVADAAGTQALLLRLITALRARIGANRPERCLVLVPAEEQGIPLVPAVAALMGTVRLESSRLKGGVLAVEGLDRLGASALAARLRPELAADDDALAVRIDADGGRHVRRFRPSSPDLGGNLPAWRRGGVYWITGGLGGLGRLFAAHLARAGAKAVVLSGRSPHGETGPFLAELAALGTAAEYLPLDVTDEAAVRDAAGAILARHGTLTGVIHCAGILRDGLIRGKEAETAAAVLAPKLHGALNLDAATRDVELELFVLCSSIAAVHGNLGQSDYAAANGFLDGFAHWRRHQEAAGRRKGRTVSLNWPLWAEGGMTVAADTLAAIDRRMGAMPMPTADGLAVLDALAGRDLGPQVVVGFGDTGKLGRFLADGDARATKPAAQSGGADAALRDAVIGHLRDLLGAVLEIDRAKIRPDVAFSAYGFDSIVAVEMIGRLEEDLGPLSKTLFFEYVDLNGIAGHLLDNCAEALRTKLMGAAAAPQPAAEQNEVLPARAAFPAPAVRGASGRRREIAVIGVGGRYPGAETLDEFWDNLASGRHAFGPIPSERWPHEEIYFPDRSVMGKSTIKTGAFLSGIDAFDPRYFSISQRDAELMSPEVRLFLQVAVETFEDAGYSRETLQRTAGGDVGVLVGTMSNHYNLYGFQNMMSRGSRATGSYTGTLPNMVSYHYGLVGPSIFVDTMCAGSATCIDLAVRLLREGQTRMVLAGGVNLLLHPYNLIASSQEHFTSATAEIIRSYGLGADGTILGEGVGAVLLKPLDDAERDGDDIRAVITGVAMTNAGIRNGFTVPSPGMQARAIRLALDDAGVDARTISYVEGHGSGTSLGDPIEIAGLTQAYRHDTPDTGFCALGSVKSNIAHLLAAAGVAGFTKLLLQLRHGKIAPSLHSERLNPAIDFESSPFRVQRELADWPAQPLQPRRAGLTSIGAGGMNAHIIVEEYAAPAPAAQPWSGRPCLMVFSAMHRKGLDAVLTRMREWLAARPDVDLTRLSYTLQVGRTALPCRLAMIAANRDELLDAIADILDGRPRPSAWLVANILETEPPAAELLADACRDADLAALAAGWTTGGTVDWSALWGDLRPRRLSLPTYPFDKIRCWVDLYPDAPGVLDPENNRRKLHPLVGRNLSGLHGVAFGTELHLEDLLDWTWRRDGRLQLLDTALPVAAAAAAGLAGMARPCLTELRQAACDWTRVRRLRFDLVPEAAPTSCRIELTAEDVDGRDALLLTARCADGGDAVCLPPTPPDEAPDILAGEAAYAALAEAGLTFAPYQRVLERVEWRADGGWAEVGVPALRQHHRMRTLGMPPEVTGAVFQTAMLAARRLGMPGWPRLVLSGAARLVVNGADGQSDPWRLDFAVHAEGNGLTGTWYVLDGSRRPLAELVDLSFRPADDAGAMAQPEAAGEALRADILAVIAGELSVILKMPVAEIHPKIGLYALGLDSISLTALIRRINDAFSTRFTPALMYEVATVEQLVAKVLEQAPAKAPAADAARPAPRIAATAARPPVRAEAAGASTDAIAVIGMAGRFPGADDLDGFWRLLRDGRQALTDLPLDRYGPAYAAAMAAAPFPKRGGFLADLGRFDADFFNLSPAEAKRLDPQHRLFLEAAWATLESAGYRPRALPSDTAVFIGVSAQDYASLMTAQGIEADAHAATGNSHAMLANRVSYFLDVHGPSEAIDTACSSSLVAVHRGMEAIRSGRCGMAMVGGVNVALSLESFLGPYRAGMLSPDGRCKTFAADADGYVRGEGVGAVLLKRLADAERDGDRIMGVLIGSAENHGGRASSLTAPNARAQSDLIVRAMGGIDPATIDHVEAHGTGTELGDPVEVNALKTAYAEAAAAFGSRPFAPGSCALGSVKTNIGHLEAAAGIAGLLKLLLALREGEIPASLNCPGLNPYLDLAGSPFAVVTERRPWAAAAGRPRRAAISSFGFGGANAHVVVEEHRPARRDDAEEAPFAGGCPVVLSARTPAQLSARAKALADHLEATPGGARLSDIAWTLAAGREPMEERLAFVAASVDEVAAILRRFLNGERQAVLGGSVRLSAGFPATKAAGDGAEAPGALYAAADVRTLLAHWIKGGAVDWRRVWGARVPRLVGLPVHPFAGSIHWIDSEEASPPRSAQRAGGDDALRLLDDLIEGGIDVDGAAEKALGGWL